MSLRVYSSVLQAALVAASISVFSSAYAQSADVARQQGPVVGTSGEQAVIPPPLAGGNSVACCNCYNSSTAINISTGQSGWTVSLPGAAPAAPRAAVVPASNPAWTALVSMPSAPAQWIGPPGAPRQSGTYIYEFPFSVPRCAIPSTVTISGAFAADNTAVLRINNGPVIATSQGTANYGYQNGSVTNFTTTVPSGSNVLKLEVANQSGPTGAVVRAVITRSCPPMPRG